MSAINLSGTYKLKSYSYANVNATYRVDGAVAATFQAGGSTNDRTLSFVTPQSVVIDITPRFGETIVPGSVNFLLGAKRYFDRLGKIYNGLEVTTGAATEAGTINYSTGVVTITDWTPGQSSAVTITSLLTTTGDNTLSGATFRIPVSPVRPGSLQVLATKVLGGSINVTAGTDGNISGTGVRGKVNYETGVVGVEFGSMVTAAGNEAQPWYDPALVVGGQIWKPQFVFADTIRFNAVAYSYLPLDAERLGLDPVRLPQDGRVAIFRKGGFVVIGHTQLSTARTAANGGTYNAGRVRLSRVRIIGFDGNTIETGYTADLEAGTVTYTNVTGWSQPVKIEDRIEDLLLVSDVQISGQLAFTRQVTHDYPVGSFVSGALVTGDLHASAQLLFDQVSWDSSTWSDSQVGSGTLSEYNDVSFPIEVANFGAVTERWIIRFTSSTAFQVIGEHVGVVATGTIGSVTAPINPATSTPFFTIREEGWGTGWSAGNIVRLNTIGAQFPVWVVRTVQQGAETVLDDKFSLLIRGDVDRP